jgi:hypothetical protein
VREGGGGEEGKRGGGVERESGLVKREGRGSLSVGDMLKDVEASGAGDGGVW